ncbi:MAG: ABC transporter permease [Egibacteraceae bacterium]
MFDRMGEQLSRFAEEFPLWFSNNYDDVISLTIDHALIVLLAILIAGVLGVSAGVLTYRRPRPREAVLRVTGLFLTIPSLALYALLITFPLLGIGFKSVLVALIMYSLLPIVRNTITGLLGVDPAIVESAQGMGMSRNQRLWRIELSLA